MGSAECHMDKKLSNYYIFKFSLSVNIWAKHDHPKIIYLDCCSLLIFDNFGLAETDSIA